jgi:hypothetical protein
MKKHIVSALVLSLIVPAIVVAGPIRESAQRHAATAAAAQPGEPHRSNTGMMWGGLGLVAGGATMAVLASTALKKETCAEVYIGWDYVAGCVEETNKALLWTGIGAAGGGAVLAILGMSANHNLQFGAGRATYAYKLKF